MNNNNNNIVIGNGNDEIERKERSIKRKLTTNKSVLTSVLLLLKRQKGRKGGALLELLRLILDLVIPFGIEMGKNEVREMEDNIHDLPEGKREPLLNDISGICDKYDECRDGLLELIDKSFSHVTEDIVDIIDKKLEEILLHPNGSVVDEISKRYKEDQ